MSLGLKKFEILLDSPDHTFSPGETIAGRVIVHLNRPKSIKGLTVRIKGKTEVKWNAGSTGMGKDKKTTYYTGEEEYFRMEISVLGRASDSENVEIQTGSHDFPFNFCLPRNIPSSFETLHGSIRYTVKAVMERPWKFDHETSILFNIVTPYDLSQCTTAMTAIDDEEYDTFCCFTCFNKGEMKVNIFLPASGFTIGEAIEAKINVNNTSESVDVTKVKLRLEQKIKLHAQFPHSKTITRSSIVQDLKKSGPFSKKGEILVGMQVPSLPYSNMIYCNLIDIEYHLRVIISVSGCHCATDKRYPIVIGTKPPLSAQSVHKPTKILPPTPIVPTCPVQTPMPMPYPSANGQHFPEDTGNGYNPPAIGFSNSPAHYGNNLPYPQAMPSPIGFITPNPMH